MDARGFADQYLSPYLQKGEEIVPTHCPYCKGGAKGDKHTFALNIEKLTFNCKRGKCGKQGTFTQLCEDFGEQADRPRNLEIKAPPKRNYKRPAAEIQTPNQRVEEYLRKRGFSPATWQRRKVGEVDGNIAMPYYENGELVLLKFRPACKVKPGERKAWREAGGKPVPWGMDDCDPLFPLIICEGEMDALALDEAGEKNVVSVPSGAEDLTWVDNVWDWLQRFQRVIIWPDNDEPGQEMCRKLIAKLGTWRCWVVKSQYKDANECLYHEGADGVRQAIDGAEEVPIAGLIRLADAKVFDIENVVRVRSSVKAINHIMGGYMMGQVSVWTGINGSGKSTLLGQELLTAIDYGFPVCAYSGELPAAMFRSWIDTQAAGPNHLAEKWDAIRERMVAYPDRKVIPAIQGWYRDRFFLYDAFGGVSVDNLLQVFTYAAQRYDCRIFLIDNLMTVMAGSASERDYYLRQSQVVGQMIEFAHRYEVHVHLVAHPRKTSGRLTKMDVAGSGDITNRADNVFAVHRVQDDERAEEGCDAILDIFKSRYTGQQNDEVKLHFDGRAKRFYQSSDPGARTHMYGWQEAQTA